MPVTLAGRDPRRGTPVEVMLAGDRVAGVRDVPPGAVPADQWLLPGLVDIQVNGYAGIDLNAADITASGVVEIVGRLARGGVTRFCPTICTQSRERMMYALGVVAAACRAYPAVARAVAGIHVEGPYISREDGPRGAHPAEYVRPPDWDELAQFQQAADGRIKILTLSPEWPGAADFIAKTVASGVIVAIGHTAASPDVIRDAVAAGARLATHLGNGAHAVLPRHPNYIWEQLAADALSASIIADGHHLPPAVVKAIVRMKGIDRTILISDAVALAGMPPGDYEWIGLKVTLSPSGRISLTGTPYLAGSALALAEAIPKVIEYAGVGLADAVTMASANPARLLGIETGGPAAGAAADFVVARYAPGAPGLEVLQTVSSGETVYANA